MREKSREALKFHAMPHMEPQHRETTLTAWAFFPWTEDKVIIPTTFMKSHKSESLFQNSKNLFK